MEQGPLPVFAGSTLSYTRESTTNDACKFAGPDYPRRLYAVHLVWIRLQSRDEIDSIAGPSNGPESIDGLHAPSGESK